MTFYLPGNSAVEIKWLLTLCRNPGIEHGEPGHGHVWGGHLYMCALGCSYKILYYICTVASSPISMYTHIHICVCVYIYVHVLVYVYVCVDVDADVDSYVYVYVHVHFNIHIYIYVDEDA